MKSRLTIDIEAKTVVVGFEIIPQGKRKPRKVVEVEELDRIWGWGNPYKVTLSDGSVLELEGDDTVRLDLGPREEPKQKQKQNYLVNILTGERTPIAAGSDGDAEFEAMYA